MEEPSIRGTWLTPPAARAAAKPQPSLPAALQAALAATAAAHSKCRAFLRHLRTQTDSAAFLPQVISRGRRRIFLDRCRRPHGSHIADLRLLFEVMAGPDPGDALSQPIPLRTQSKLTRALSASEFWRAPRSHRQPETTTVQPRRNFSLAGLTLELFASMVSTAPSNSGGFSSAPVIGHLLSSRRARKSNQPMLRDTRASNTSRPHHARFLHRSLARRARPLARKNSCARCKRSPLLSPVSSAPRSFTARKHRPGTGYLDTMRFSQWLNLAGFPGASVRSLFSNEGLPIGVQIIGRRH